MVSFQPILGPPRFGTPPWGKRLSALEEAKQHRYGNERPVGLAENPSACETRRRLR